MEYVINYSLYIIAGIAVLVPILAFGIFAPGIATVVIATFVGNTIAQLQDLKFFEELQKKIDASSTHGEESSSAWLDQAVEAQPEHHVISISTYFWVLMALFVGTVVTVWVSYFNFGRWNMVIAFLVASCKAFFVLAYFMHLKYDNMLNRVIFLSAFFFLLIMFSFSFGDIISRILPTKGF